MKKNLLFGAMILLAGSVFGADATPKDEVTAAAKKLADKPNYSWKSSTQFGNFDSSATGKLEKSGATLLSMTFGDNTTEAAFKEKKIAVKTADQDWQTVEELNKGAEGPDQFMGRMLQNFKAPAAEVEDLVAKSKELKKKAMCIPAS